ncbi:MAG: succinylglutamate-semialdehyde dehydrogenase [Ponticaulis sp.]|nr:succinylglutamate-semialdehyde dehydrogenase [Ponticaulis sp.]
MIQARSESLIAGIWETGAGAEFSKTCPATGALSWRGQAASADQVHRAVAGAHAALSGWADTALEDRIAVLRAYGKALEKRKAEIAQLISQDMGKTLTESQGEAASMIGKIELSISAYADRTGEQALDTAFGRFELCHKPVGVMAVFGPYNFPGHLPNGHIVPALLAGNTCVFKPSELAPSVAPLMADCFEEAGLPPGCLSIVQGGRDTGQALLESEINGLLFTGSERTGRYFHKTLGGRPDVMLALEMGGNNPLIVWDPAEPTAAANLVIQSAFLTSGQRCTCARRLIIPDNAFGDAVLAEVIDRAAVLRSGAWLEDDAFMGPLVSAESAAQAVRFQDDLVKRGGRLRLALQQSDPALGFVSAGIVDMTGTDVPDEECFAPLLQVFRVETLDDAITLANRTRFGLSAGLVSDDDDIWNEVRRRVRVGILNRNRPTVGASGKLPFGGPGMSGNFRPGGYYAADYCAWPQASQIEDQLTV